MRRWLGVAIAAAVFGGCGGGGDDGGSKIPGVDEAVIPVTLQGFAAANRDRYPTMTLPTWSAADARVTGYVPAGVDPIVFCQELVDHIGTTIGTQGATVSIAASPESGTPLAIGPVGGTCLPAS